LEPLYKKKEPKGFYIFFEISCLEYTEENCENLQI